MSAKLVTIGATNTLTKNLIIYLRNLLDLVIYELNNYNYFISQVDK